MIFLEQTVNQILQEEGQMILSLSDLGITWPILERQFIGTFEQAKDYITIYDWVNEVIGIDGVKKPEWTNVRHITYNAYNNMQRFMPDVPGQYWEFNPYTKNMTSLMSTNFSLEVGKHPTCGKIEYCLEFNDLKQGQTYNFSLPFSFSNLTIKDMDENTNLALTIKAYENENNSSNTCSYLERTSNCVCNNINTSREVEITGNDINGTFSDQTLTGSFVPNKDYRYLLFTFTTQYAAIKELDLTCELFYNWFKGNTLTMIGSIKKQVDLQGIGLPFDFNSDDLLARGREIMTKVEELKGTKSHWSNF